jgi:hypothetical protein
MQKAQPLLQTWQTKAPSHAVHASQGDRLLGVAAEVLTASAELSMNQQQGPNHSRTCLGY